MAASTYVCIHTHTCAMQSHQCGARSGSPQQNNLSSVYTHAPLPKTRLVFLIHTVWQKELYNIASWPNIVTLLEICRKPTNMNISLERGHMVTVHLREVPLQLSPSLRVHVCVCVPAQNRTSETACRKLDLRTLDRTETQCMLVNYSRLLQ